MYTNIIHNDDICNYFLKNQQFIFNSLGNCREYRLFAPAPSSISFVPLTRNLSPAAPSLAPSTALGTRNGPRSKARRTAPARRWADTKKVRPERKAPLLSYMTGLSRLRYGGLRRGQRKLIIRELYLFRETFGKHFVFILHVLHPCHNIHNFTDYISYVTLLFILYCYCIHAGA